MATVRIEQRSQKSYTLIIDHGIAPATGKRHKETRIIKTTDRSVAERERDIILGQLANESYRPLSKTTVKEYITHWLTTPAFTNLASKTQSNYKMHIDVRIIPWLGLIKLASLTRTDLNNFYNRIITEGSNPKDKNSKTAEKTKTDNNTPPKPIGKETILYNHRIIHRILNDAVYVDEILQRNVADRMILPEPPKPANYDPDEDLVKVFTGTEIITLETNADSTSYSELLTVALRTGMRRGELLALSWDAIDYKAKTIFVKRALSYTKEKGYEFKLTKNNTRRKIEVTTEVLDALRIQGLVHQILQEKLGTYYEDNNLVFCREDGKPMYPGTPSSWFPAFCVSNGLPKLTFHCLRHTHASQLLSTGEDISYVSKRLGHSDVSVTYKRYFHLIPLEQRDSLRALEKKFKK